MAYAKDGPWQYMREFNGTRYTGLLVSGSVEQAKNAVQRLRNAGIQARAIKGVYGSRRHGDAFRGWMIFVVDGCYTKDQQDLMCEMEDEL